MTITDFPIRVPSVFHPWLDLNFPPRYPPWFKLDAATCPRRQKLNNARQDVFPIRPVQGECQLCQEQAIFDVEVVPHPLNFEGQIALLRREAGQHRGESDSVSRI